MNTYKRHRFPADTFFIDEVLVKINGKQPRAARNKRRILVSLKRGSLKLVKKPGRPSRYSRG